MGADTERNSQSAPSEVKLRSVCSKLWSQAWPLSWSELLAFSKALILISFVGHVLPDQLGPLVLAQSLYQSTGTTVLLGLSGAMETFAGQAYGAGAFSRVGDVLQQALATTFLCCCGVIGLWAWMSPLMLALGQEPALAASASHCLIALAPALLCEAADQCCQLYLSVQSITHPIASATLAATLLTPIYLYMCCRWLNLGLLGVALAWNAVQATSLSLMVVSCMQHTRAQPSNKSTWHGWSTTAFKGWGSYLRVAGPSCIMLCSESWATEALVMLSGLLPNPQLSVSMMAITANLHDMCYRSTAGLGTATSTLVAQSLGAGRPSTARLTVRVAAVLGTLWVWSYALALLLGRHHVGWLFTSDRCGVALTAHAIPAMALSLFSEGANTVLAGAVRGCGKQKIGALVGLIYWVIGLPLACWLAFKMQLGAVGLWIGMMGVPTVLQTLINSVIMHMVDWHAEAARAQELAAQEAKHTVVGNKADPGSCLPLHSSPDDDTLLSTTVTVFPGGRQPTVDGTGTGTADNSTDSGTELVMMASVDQPLLATVSSDIESLPAGRQGRQTGRKYTSCCTEPECECRTDRYVAREQSASVGADRCEIAS